MSTTPELVTLEQVNNALRLDLDGDLASASADDGDEGRFEDIMLKIDQATDIVLDYLKMDPAYVEWTVETVPGRVSAAIILVVKSLYDDSASAEMLTGLANNNLANPVVALLYRLRDPAHA